MIIRQDDFDPRTDLETLQKVHEEFVKRDMLHTIAVNNSMGLVTEIEPEVLDYVNTTDHWDIQLHGYHHELYYHWGAKDLYPHIAANLLLTKRDFSKSNPTVFYPPWNKTSDALEAVCKKLGLTVNAECEYIDMYLNWDKRDTGVIYYHMWDKKDIGMLPLLLDTIKEIQDASR